MTTITEKTRLDGARLAKDFRRKVDEFLLASRDIDEGRAGRAPAGRWTPKEIASHLCGPEGVGIIPPVKAYLEQDTPLLDLVIEDPFYTGKRPDMSLTALLAEFESEYDRLIEVVKGLSPEQLERKARIPVFKETPLGEYPTLRDYLGVIADFHLGFHTQHLKEVLQESA